MSKGTGIDGMGDSAKAALLASAIVVLYRRIELRRRKLRYLRFRLVLIYTSDKLVVKLLT